VPRDRGAVTGRFGCAWMPCSWLSGAVAERARGAVSRRVRAPRLSDSLVLAHTRALLTSSTEGSTDHIDADLNDPDALLRIAGKKLDFSRSVAIMLMGILGHLGNPGTDDDHVAQSIVGKLKAALPSGGYLAVYDSCDSESGLNDALHKYNESGAVPYRVRGQDQIARFFDGLELVDPGMVPIQRWRPGPTQADPPEDPTNMSGVRQEGVVPSPSSLPRRQ